MSTEVANPVTGAKQAYIQGDGLYSAITGRKIRTIIGASGAGGLTAVDMAQWDIADGDIHVETELQGGNYYYCDYPVTILTFEGIETTFAEIVVQFSCAGSVTFPDTLQWIGTPSFEAGKTYVISIINNIAVSGEIV